MSNNYNYYKKYLKYKNLYLNSKNMSGGSIENGSHYGLHPLNVITEKDRYFLNKIETRLKKWYFTNCMWDESLYEFVSEYTTTQGDKEWISVPIDSVIDAIISVVQEEVDDKPELVAQSERYTPTDRYDSHTRYHSQRIARKFGYGEQYLSRERKYRNSNRPLYTKKELIATETPAL